MYEFEVQASEQGSLSENTGTTRVRIAVLDENDNRPEFDETAYSFELPENQVGFVVGNISASDLDIGTNAKVSI